MDFYEVIESHLAWKLELKKAINGDHNSLISAKLASSDINCDLGQWIIDNMENYRQLDIFRQLRAEHAAFHQFAGEVVHAIEKGQAEQAEQILQTDVTHLSRLLVRTLVKLSRDTNQS